MHFIETTIKIKITKWNLSSGVDITGWKLSQKEKIQN